MPQGIPQTATQKKKANHDKKTNLSLIGAALCVTFHTFIFYSVYKHLFPFRKSEYAKTRRNSSVRGIMLGGDPSSLFRGKKILAPMVRAGTLPFRELCLDFGADLVYGEELVDRSIMICRRVSSDDGARVDFVKGEGEQASLRPIFSILSANSGRTVFQMGTNNPDNALAAAQLVINDVAGVDVNMGCPKEFSVKGGMGAALMEQPEQVAAILRSLRLNLPVNKSVTCKIRVFPELRRTVEFAQMVERCGINALAVHGRTRDQRDQHPADWSAIAQIKAALQIPLVLNGDVFCFEDFERARRETGADSVMTARGALANASIFGPQAVDTVTVARRYVDKAVQLRNNFQNTKWVVLRMLGGVSRKVMLLRRPTFFQFDSIFSRENRTRLTRS